MLRKLLIVDDDVLNHRLYSEMLGKDSYDYVFALNGVECLEAVERDSPCMVIMDWKMPKMDGLEALKQLKSNGSTDSIPVLMVTGVMTSPVNLMTALEEGAVDYLNKPFDRLELRARVRNMLMLSDTVMELKEKYHLIESSSKMIEALFAGIPHPLVYYTTEGIIIRYNRPFEELHGREGVSYEGRLIYGLLPDETRTMHLHHDMEMIGTRREVTYESTHGNDGAQYLFAKNLHHSPGGEVSGIVCSITDITLIKHAHTQMMESKKRELVSSALRLIHISEMNNSLISELSGLNVYLNKEGRERAQRLINNYHMHSSSTVWQDFEARFGQVFEVFYQRMHAQFPDLTPGEKKLCALLRLNISSKDIAAITLQNSQSVDMARYRLRKKLNLSSDDNLVDFLLKIDQ